MASATKDSEPLRSWFEGQELFAGPRSARPHEVLLLQSENTMTKRDFIAIARAIAAIGNMIDRQNAAHAIADHAASVNPRFDRARFLAACGC